MKITQRWLFPVLLAGVLLAACDVSDQGARNHKDAGIQSSLIDEDTHSINLTELGKHGKLTKIEKFKSVPHQAVLDLGMVDPRDGKDKKFIEIFDRSCERAGGIAAKNLNEYTALQSLMKLENSDTAYVKILSVNLRNEHNFGLRKASRCAMLRDEMEILTEITTSEVSICPQPCELKHAVSVWRGSCCTYQFFVFVQNDEDIKLTRLLADQVKNEIELEKKSMNDVLNSAVEVWQRESQKLRNSLKSGNTGALVSSRYNVFSPASLPERELYMHTVKIIEVKPSMALVQIRVIDEDPSAIEIAYREDQIWVNIDEIHAEVPDVLFCYSQIKEGAPDDYVQVQNTDRYKGGCFSVGSGTKKTRWFDKPESDSVSE